MNKLIVRGPLAWERRECVIEVSEGSDGVNRRSKVFVSVLLEVI